MGAFSSLIDISSFFVGILINLLLIAMICYYFKRKIDNLEVSQSEQAKMLYGIISQQQQIESQKFNDSIVHGMNDSQSVSVLGGLNLSQLENTVEDENEPRVVDMTENNNELAEDSDDEVISNDESETDDDDDDDDDDEGSEIDTEGEVEDEPEPEQESTKSINYDVDGDVGKVYEYDKMTVRELKEVLGNKGVQNIKSNIKKQDLIDILVREDNKEPEPTFMKSEEVLEVEEMEGQEEGSIEEVSEMNTSIDDVIDVENNTELVE